MATTTIEATFKWDKATKGSVVFREIDAQGQMYINPSEPGCKVGVLYIRKTAFNGGSVPKTLILTLTSTED